MQLLFFIALVLVARTTFLVCNKLSVIDPLQLAIHVVQNRHVGTQSHTGTRQTKGIHILNGNFLCLSCPSATFVSQHGSFVPREWKAAKGLFYVLKLKCTIFMTVMGDFFQGEVV